ncbi:MAG: hypothetical protein V3S07_06315, partial [Micropepsaceae bacterium]
AKNKAGLKRLSGERVQKELLRLLEADDPGPALGAMQKHNILGEILPAPLHLERLSKIIANAMQKEISRGAIVSLAALLPSEKTGPVVASKLKFSNAHREQLIEILSDYSKITPQLSSREVGKFLYRYGKERFGELMLLSWAEFPDDPGWEPISRRATEWTQPKFPIGGHDLIEAGAREGPSVGRILSGLERWWVDENFIPDRDDLLAKLKETLSE